MSERSHSRTPPRPARGIRGGKAARRKREAYLRYQEAQGFDRRSVGIVHAGGLARPLYTPCTWEPESTTDEEGETAVFVDPEGLQQNLVDIVDLEAPAPLLPLSRPTPETVLLKARPKGPKQPSYPPPAKPAGPKQPGYPPPAVQSSLGVRPSSSSECNKQCSETICSSQGRCQACGSKGCSSKGRYQACGSKGSSSEGCSSESCCFEGCGSGGWSGNNSSKDTTETCSSDWSWRAIIVVCSICQVFRSDQPTVFEGSRSIFLQRSWGSSAAIFGDGWYIGSRGSFDCDWLAPSDRYLEAQPEGGGEGRSAYWCIASSSRRILQRGQGESSKSGSLDCPKPYWEIRKKSELPFA